MKGASGLALQLKTKNNLILLRENIYCKFILLQKKNHERVMFLLDKLKNSFTIYINKIN